MTSKHSSSKMSQKILTPIFRFRGIPIFPKNFFPENRFTLLEIQTSFFNFLPKFQKHALEDSLGKISVEVKFWISPFLAKKFYFFKIMLHNFEKKNRNRAKIRNFTSTEIFPRDFSSACLKNEVWISKSGTDFGRKKNWGEWGFSKPEK